MKKLLNIYMKYQTTFLFVFVFLLLGAIYGLGAWAYELQKGLNEQAFEEIAKECYVKNFDVTYSSPGIKTPSAKNFKQLVYRDMWEVGTAESHFGKITRYDPINDISYSMERSGLSHYYHARLVRNKKTISITFDCAMGLVDVCIIIPQGFCNDEGIKFYDECVEYENGSNREYYFFGRKSELPPYSYREVSLKDDTDWWKSTDKRMFAEFFN